MQQGQFKIIDDYLCIRMPKEIDHHNAEILSKKVDNYIYGEKVNHVVFDFIDTEFMDSSGIGIIAGRYKKVQCFGGNVYILNAGKQVNRILMLSGIQKYVVFMKD
jgi:stage II sporulation protein AA (anti-sigma F factor antagonist)